MTPILRDADRFYLPGTDAGAPPLAEITFVRGPGNSLVIDHTFVDDCLGGQGIGKQLVRRVAELAREEGAVLTSTCWFASKVLALDSH